jgi:hypothetical protein
MGAVALRVTGAPAAAIETALGALRRGLAIGNAAGRPYP